MIPKRDRSVGRGLTIACAMTAGLVASGALVWQGSQAAFTGTVSNSGNNWTSGTVSLTNNRGSAMFDTSAQPIKPNDPHQRCIQVTYGGNLAAQVKVYASNYSDDGLASSLTVKIEEGSGGVFGNAECTDASGFNATAVTGTIFNGTMDAFAAKGNFAQGVGVWAPATAGAKVYRISYELTSSSTSVQGKTTDLDFVWEAQNS